MIYSKSGKVFQDLEDLPGVVVFFDEMDALVKEEMMIESHSM